MSSHRYNLATHRPDEACLSHLNPVPFNRAMLVIDYSDILKKLQKIKSTWGIEDSYFPFKISIAPLDNKDLEHSKQLTPQQRIEWLLMMQRLLLKQFHNKKK
ncbi:MAG: hypothetical protein HYS98_08775 [Deltaproteobacteria bacterium]|nr:hypothetical protein [Deltaproteobacteria bacterium]